MQSGGHWVCKEYCTVALAADLQLGALLDALIDEEHDLVKLLLGHLRGHPSPKLPCTSQCPWVPSCIMRSYGTLQGRLD